LGSDPQILDAIIRAMRCVVRQRMGRLCAVVEYVDSRRIVAVLATPSLSDCRMAVCMGSCAEVCGFEYMPVPREIQFRRSRGLVAVSSEGLERAMSLLRCLDQCMRSGLRDGLATYRLHTWLEPYVLEAYFGKLLVALAIAPLQLVARDTKNLVNDVFEYGRWLLEE